MMKLVLRKYDWLATMLTIIVFTYVLGNAHIVRQTEVLNVAVQLVETLGYVGLIIYIFSCRFSLKRFLVIGFSLAVLFACYLATGQADLLKSMVLIVAVMQKRSSYIFSYLFQAFVAALALVFVLYLVGVSNAGEQRRGSISLGFGSPNVASRMIQTAVLLWFMRGKISRIDRKSIAVAVFCGLFVILTTGSRFSAVVIIGYPFVVYLLNMLQKKGRSIIWEIVLCSLPALCMLLTIVTANAYNTNSTIQMINIALSNRVYMNYMAIKQYCYTLFGVIGNMADLVGSYDAVVGKYVNFMTIDSQYVYMLVYYGVIGSLITLLGMTVTIKKAMEKKNLWVAGAILMLTIYSVTETVGSVMGLIPLLYLFMSDNSVIGTSKN